MCTDKQIVIGCKKLNKKAQKALYERYAPVLLGICMRYASNKQEAEDILHDCFMKIFLKINQYKERGSFEGWIKRLTINTAITYLKKNKQLRHTYDFNEIDELDIKHAVNDNANSAAGDETLYLDPGNFTQEDIMTAVNQLPDGYRLVFNMYVFDNCKHKEIAQELDIDINTSKSQLSRARKQIKKRLQKIYLMKYTS